MAEEKRGGRGGEENDIKRKSLIQKKSGLKNSRKRDHLWSAKSPPKKAQVKILYREGAGKKETLGEDETGNRISQHVTG